MHIIGPIFIAILIFVIVFVFLRVLTLVNNKIHGLDYEISVPVKYIKKKYKLRFRETKTKRLRLLIDLINTLAITIPIYIILFIGIKSNILKYVISLIIFITIILGGYNLVGIILTRKEKK